MKNWFTLVGCILLVINGPKQSATAAVHESPKQSSLSIEAWYNQFGNNLTQIIKAFSFAQKQHASITIPDHPSPMLSRIAGQTFSFGQNDLPPSLYFFEHVSIKEQLNVLKEIILPLIVWPRSITETASRSIVIHIRNGDIWDTHGKKAWSTPESFIKNYIQPPLEFYRAIFDHHPDITNVVLVMDHKGTPNPVVQPLLLLIKAYEKQVITLSSASLEEDFWSLVFAQDILVHAQSTLSSTAGMMNFLLTQNSIQYIHRLVQHRSPEAHDFLASYEEKDDLIAAYNQRVKVLLIGGEFGKTAIRLRHNRENEWLTSRHKVMELYTKPVPAITYCPWD